MKTNYGELDVVIDEATGRATRKRMRGGATTALEASQVKHVAPGKRALPVPNPAPAPTAAGGFDSKLEALRDRHLRMLILAGEIKRVIYHPFTVHIGPRRTYTPDFLVEYVDGRIVIEEVKGDLRQKNARDSVTRLHVAAGLLPMFGWRLVVGAEMEEREVGVAVSQPQNSGEVSASR